MATPQAAATRLIHGERFVRGHVRDLDDVRPFGLFHIAFLRSAGAHAMVRDIVSASELKSVDLRAFLTGEQAAAIGELASQVPARLPSTGKSRNLPSHTVGRVRHAGEPLALVAAASWKLRVGGGGEPGPVRAVAAVAQHCGRDSASGLRVVVSPLNTPRGGADDCRAAALGE